MHQLGRNVAKSSPVACDSSPDCIIWMFYFVRCLRQVRTIDLVLEYYAATEEFVRQQLWWSIRFIFHSSCATDADNQRVSTSPLKQKVRDRRGEGYVSNSEFWKCNCKLVVVCSRWSKRWFLNAGSVFAGKRLEIGRAWVGKAGHRPIRGQIPDPCGQCVEPSSDKTLNPKLLPMLHHHCVNVCQWFRNSQLRWY